LVGVATAMLAGAAITPGLGRTTDGLSPVARSSIAGSQSQTAASSSARVRFTPPSGDSDQPVTRAGKGTKRSSATIAPSQGRSRRAARLAGKATSRWRRLRSSSALMIRCTVLTEVVSGNSMSR